MPCASPGPYYLPPPRAAGAVDSEGAADGSGNGGGVWFGLSGGCDDAVVVVVVP